MERITVSEISARKGKEKIVMLTCYDYSFAAALDSAFIDILLVGDSMGQVVLGLDDIREISVEEMLNHTRAVFRGSSRPLVVADMPYSAYQKDPGLAVDYARKFIEEGAGAVKVEWFEGCSSVVEKLRKEGIEVMGHVGLTPQTADLLGGLKVQGKDEISAERILDQACLLSQLGVFSLVLECLPAPLARAITEKVSVATIGIGAGAHCDGQVLVIYDLLGLYRKIKPRFVRAYGDISSDIASLAEAFSRDVRSGNFPSEKESY